MNYQDLGYNDTLQQHKTQQGLGDFEVGRVILEHKERYVVKTPTQEYEAELMGNLRFSANSRYDLPAVGDWVAFMEYDEGKALIQAVYPRHSIIERKAVGKTGQVQIIATNIDYGLIVQAVDRDFNLNRIERYLTICNSSKVNPIIVLSKVDLISDAELANINAQIQERINDVPVAYVSNTSIGYSQIEQFIEVGKTYCLLGSSGVGKSTLLNGLAGTAEMKTAEISTAVNKGKHTTSHRELIVLANGGILIDNPGMREVGITDTSGGLELTFESILDYAEHCRYNDCTHMHEQGCAIIEAVENGEIDEAAYANFQKMEKERMHYDSDAQERKKKGKDLGKLIKNMKKDKKKNNL
ncbi:ribosome small subunit-dependent GTPase A [Saccharicrinis aurantiacus]|uniref:ribosome small subunit-dependent GTPase A n=1 Tax=Saccharicrinis aurantiacus TaxID=1849719 RepID=UPI002492635B|nr:ribosome small subunit-dependent GTPase A [Saccharicrinis aurantiacus]